MLAKLLSYKEKLFFLAILLIFLLVLFKDPFSTRTLIPEFDPFPDSIYYVNPSLSFLKGQGFNVVRKNQAITPVVPVLYSVSLVPIFAVFLDPRMFFATNVILAIISLTLLWLILNRITNNPWIKYFIAFLYVTNYIIYWYPSLGMAENLILPLFLASVLTIFLRLTFRNLLLAAFLVVSFYATKYAAIPLTLTFFFIFLIIIFIVKNSKKIKLKYLLFYLASFLLMGFIFESYEFSFKHMGLLVDLGRFIVPISNTTPLASATITPAFSLQYVKHNLPIYISLVTGDGGPILWQYISLM